MERSFDLTTILAGMERLNATGRFAFGVCILERALSGFLQFQSETGSVGGGELRAALAHCWSTLENGVAPRDPFVTLAACENILPDSEDYASAYTSAAIDAINIACNLLAYSQEPKLDLLVDSVHSRRDTFDLYIQNALDLDPADSHFEEKIANHPLMQEELGFMHGDVVFLQEAQQRGVMNFVPILDRAIGLDYRRLRLKFSGGVR